MCTSNQASLLLARIRSDLHLCSKSRLVPTGTIEVVRSQVASDLERRNIIYPPQLKRIGFREDMKLSERKQLLEIDEFERSWSEPEVQFRKFMEASADKARKSEWAWRIGRETYERDLEGWYPFFVTLTVDPKRVEDPAQMWKDGREWQKYVRRLSDTVTKAMGRRPARKDGVSTNQYVRYAGILEHGTSREHHHMHAIIWLREIPSSWKRCPNRNIVNPRERNRQRCLPLEAMWPHADPLRRPAKYFRFDGDIWSRLGFAMPVVKGKAMRSQPPQKAGFYLMKYTQKESREWKHRVKATAGIGLMTLRAVLRKMPLKEVEALVWRPESYRLNLFLQTIHNVPIGLARSEARRISFYRKWGIPSLDLTDHLEPSFGAFSEMLQSVKDGHRPHRMDSAALYGWLGQFLSAPPEYCRVRLADAHRSLMREFPAIEERQVNHFGGNDSGYSCGF